MMLEALNQKRIIQQNKGALSNEGVLVSIL